MTMTFGAWEKIPKDISDYLVNRGLMDVEFLEMKAFALRKNLSVY
jgi:hypothetical protein